jgi:hypothetical protein
MVSGTILSNPKLLLDCSSYFYMTPNIEISTLPQIAKATNLSIAQVFISLLFGDFKLMQSGDFYEGFKIKVIL